MKRLLSTTIFTLLTLFSLSAQPKRPTISLELDRDSIAIGDQVTLSVFVDKDMMQIVAFPEIDQARAMGRIEVLESSDIDTVSTEGRNMRLSKRYRLTSFNAGNYRVSDYPVLYADKNIIDTLYSPDTVVLKVGTFDIDTTKMSIKDIRPIKDMPVKFGEWGGYAGVSLAGLLFLALLVWIIIRLIKHKPIFSKAKPAEPPHVRAIRELNELQHQKLWQNGRHKDYYTRLTDILREYIDGRFGISAMEMTSKEIIKAISTLGLEPQQIELIDELLRTADFVKFAQQGSEAEQNERFHTGVYYFVENTKQINPDAENKEYKEAMKV